MLARGSPLCINWQWRSRSLQWIFSPEITVTMGNYISAGEKNTCKTSWKKLSQWKTIFWLKKKHFVHSPEITLTFITTSHRHVKRTWSTNAARTGRAELYNANDYHIPLVRTNQLDRFSRSLSQGSGIWQVRQSSTVMI
jgi:hypothetical protein